MTDEEIVLEILGTTCITSEKYKQAVKLLDDAIWAEREVCARILDTRVEALKIIGDQNETPIGALQTAAAELRLSKEFCERLMKGTVKFPRETIN